MQKCLGCPRMIHDFSFYCSMCLEMLDAHVAPHRSPSVPRLEPIQTPAPILVPCSGCGHDIWVSQPPEAGVTLLCANCDKRQRGAGWFDRSWGQGEAKRRQPQVTTICPECHTEPVAPGKRLCPTCEWAIQDTVEQPAITSLVVREEDVETTPALPALDTTFWTEDEWERLIALDEFYRKQSERWQRSELRYATKYNRIYNAKWDVVEALEHAMGPARDYWERGA